MTEKASVDLVWRLHTVMSERGIRSSTELHRRIVPYGIDITSHQLARIVAKLPERLNMQVLAALMTELDCEASDLIRASAPTANQQQRRPAKSTAPAAVPPDVTGPNVATLRPALDNAKKP
ncbi:helix-turn-helix domain-containing protein [Roseateles sp. L2-2]|uniref:helix-turn-helix domain-containing protein n=1 Tax=Roseateles sp. L2-2 TaxID=3422597 RepID=UPI003D3634A3